jgi:hypothetical protein
MLSFKPVSRSSTSKSLFQAKNSSTTTKPFVSPLRRKLPKPSPEPARASSSKQTRLNPMTTKTLTLTAKAPTIPTTTTPLAHLDPTVSTPGTTLLEEELGKTTRASSRSRSTFTSRARRPDRRRSSRLRRARTRRRGSGCSQVGRRGGGRSTCMGSASMSGSG